MRGLLVFFSALLLAGCVHSASQGNAYDVYFLSSEADEVPESALMSERRFLMEGEEAVQGLLDCLLAGPVTEELEPAIPAGVTLLSWSLREGLLTVDFSGRYGSLSGVALTLADYSVVLTLSQVEGVETVMITADGDLLSYRDHQGLAAHDVCRQVFQREKTP